MAKGLECGVLIVKADVMLKGMADLVQHIRRPQLRPGGLDKIENLRVEVQAGVAVQGGRRRLALTPLGVVATLLVLKTDTYGARLHITP